MFERAFLGRQFGDSVSSGIFFSGRACPFHSISNIRNINKNIEFGIAKQLKLSYPLTTTRILYCPIHFIILQTKQYKMEPKEAETREYVLTVGNVEKSVATLVDLDYNIMEIPRYLLPKGVGPASYMIKRRRKGATSSWKSSKSRWRSGKWAQPTKSQNNDFPESMQLIASSHEKYEFTFDKGELIRRACSLTGQSVRNQFLLLQTYKIQMQGRGEELYWLAPSTQYQPTKALLESIDKKLTDDKEVPKDKKQNYTRVIREMNYTMGKLLPRWPVEIEKIVDNLRGVLQEFENTLIAVGKGSSFFCGSSTNPKQLENIYSRLIGYERLFEIVRPFQDRQIRDDIIAKYEEERSKFDTSRKSSKKDFSVAEPVVIEKKVPEATAPEKCRNCQLMLAVSLCPNGYIAKKLIAELPDTQWISGILHEEGTVVDKNLDKAIEFYKAAYKKKNYEALYRLGSLNERGLYGKPFEYLKMWEEASANGHLQALTDMGYLYENGLEDEETGRTILEPNYDKAFSYYSKAAEKNFPRALNNLATFYFSNDKYKDEVKCLKYLEMAAEAEYVKSLHNLGLIYYQGKLVKPNEEKSKNLIRRAAQKGDIEGRIMYVEMMLNDANSCTVDKLTDLNRFCREIIAKDEENAEAYYFLGIMFEEGYGCNKQPKTAFLYYTIAASMENDSANMKLGECYKNGFGTEQDLREAIRCFQQAVRTNKEALICLGEIYEKGGHDLNPNYQKAFEYYYEACNFGIPEAYIHLGNMYKYGRHVKRNDAKAEQYFQRAQTFEARNATKLASSSSNLIQSSYYRRR